jgi:ABC-type transport system substrate-binding protein
MVRDKLKTLIGVLIILSTVFLFSSCNEGGRTENTLIVGWATPVHSLNPILTPSITWPDGLWSAIDMIYDTLIMYDTDLNPIPGLAKSWYVKDDGITWILRLQEGVKWHDGMPFSAEDVKFTLCSRS